MHNWHNYFSEVDPLAPTAEELIQKIERVIASIKDNYTPLKELTILCKHEFYYYTLRESMWKAATIKYRGRWRAHKQQGITKLSRKQWIKENH